MGVGGRGKWVMGTEEGTRWGEHRVLYGNQFDNKFHIKIKKKKKTWKIGKRQKISPQKQYIGKRFFTVTINAETME